MTKIKNAVSSHQNRNQCDGLSLAMQIARGKSGQRRALCFLTGSRLWRRVGVTENNRQFYVGKGEKAR